MKFRIQVVDHSQPEISAGCPAVTIHGSDFLLGARMIAEGIAKDRGNEITVWDYFAGSPMGRNIAGDPVALIEKMQ